MMSRLLQIPSKRPTLSYACETTGNCFASFAVCSNATMLFEGVAPAGSLLNVNPAAPYTESGFTLTPTNNQSAVFDAGDTAASFPGDPTSWFGFAASNTITLTGLGVFNLNDLLVGASTLGSGNVDVTFLGNLAGGGTVSTTFAGLTGATLETLNWGGLSSVVITSTSDSGLDNIDAVASPEPGTWLLLGAGLSAIAARYRRRSA
jgi:hypothetical protein